MFASDLYIMQDKKTKYVDCHLLEHDPCISSYRRSAVQFTQLWPA